MSDYGMPSYRKSKNDKRAKGRFNKYKKGGRFRSSNVEETKEKKN